MKIGKTRDKTIFILTQRVISNKGLKGTLPMNPLLDSQVY